MSIDWQWACEATQSAAYYELGQVESPRATRRTRYTSIRYSDRLQDAGALASIGSVGGESYDNAMAETVVGLYKTDGRRHDGPFRSVDDLGLATLFWVHWFNTSRLHSSICNIPPIEYEQKPLSSHRALAEDTGALASLH